MTLPTQKTTPSANLYDYAILLYGETKVGKSTLLSGIDDNLFLNTSGALGGLECYNVPIPSWTDFLYIGAEIIKGDHRFKVITIDTIDRLHKMCQDYMMDKLGIKHPSEMEWGKGWELVKIEFMRPIMKLVLSKYGIVFISWAKSAEIKTRTQKINKWIPTMSDSLYNIISPLSDIILFYDIVEGKDGTEQRILRTDAAETWVAGDRTGRLAAYGDIELDPLPANNWTKVQKIFNGEIKREGLNNG